MADANQVRLTSRAAKELCDLPTTAKKRTGAVMEGLKSNHAPGGSRQLAGFPALRRIRIGAFRIVYAVEKAAKGKLITVARIGPRAQVYRNLKALGY